jgi:hypothetical protein
MKFARMVFFIGGVYGSIVLRPPRLLEELTGRQNPPPPLIPSVPTVLSYRRRGKSRCCGSRKTGRVYRPMKIPSIIEKLTSRLRCDGVAQTASNCGIDIRGGSGRFGICGFVHGELLQVAAARRPALGPCAELGPWRRDCPESGQGRSMAGFPEAENSFAGL